jgi:hypothetical protein
MQLQDAACLSASDEVPGYAKPADATEREGAWAVSELTLDRPASRAHIELEVAVLAALEADLWPETILEIVRTALEDTSDSAPNLHRCFIERPSRRWQAQCSCGWKGDRKWHPGLAESQATRHQERRKGT